MSHQQAKAQQPHQVRGLSLPELRRSLSDEALIQGYEERFGGSRYYRIRLFYPLPLRGRGQALYSFPAYLPNEQHFGFAKPELPDFYSYDRLGFFCKWEVKLQEATRWPVRFRLGDVDYVDWLEGKRHSY